MKMTELTVSAEVRDMDGRMDFGTARTREILKRLSFPERGYKIIHVAGTNGKGSVAEYMTDILIAAGKKTGTFTSPAVLDYNEQFRINGQPINSAVLERCFADVKSAGKHLNPTQFEIQTAGTLLAFKQEGCEYAVVECGLGGLNDATNAISQKSLALITSVSLEHTTVLGNTVTEICRQKAGIISGCPAIVSALQCGEGAGYFKGLGVSSADKPLNIAEQSLNGTEFIYGGERFFIKIHGEAQPYNAALAIEGARLLGISADAIRQGLAQAQIAGRLQTVQKGERLYILDGAHNPASFVTLAEFLKKFAKSEDTAIVSGCLSDKDIDGNLQALEGLARNIYAVQPQSPRAMDGQKILEACKRHFKNADECGSVADALERAENFKTTVICGSFTLIKEAMEWIEKK